MIASCQRVASGLWFELWEVLMGLSSGFLLAFSISSDPDIADQGQVLVVVTASVGGFSLLVILTLFLLITGR